jgi:prophage endopeptidase
MNPLMIVALFAFSIGSGAGWFVTDAVLGKQIVRMVADDANEKAVAEKVYRERFAAAQALGDTLSDRLAQTEFHLTQKTKELSNALSKVTTGRACLNGAAVRLLNNTDNDSNAVPKTTGTSAAEDAAVATDTDIADWIGSAKGQYETCRARLAALIDFETQKDVQHD